MRREKLVKRLATTSLPTRHGTFQSILYESMVDGRHHLALVLGEMSAADEVLVRVQSECLAGDALGSLGCDCGEKLRTSLELVGEAGTGVLVYIREASGGAGEAADGHHEAAPHGREHEIHERRVAARGEQGPDDHADPRRHDVLGC